MELLTYIIVALVVFALCGLGMAIGLIFRNKPIRACGNAARDFEGQQISCAACGARNASECKEDSETDAARRPV